MSGGIDSAACAYFFAKKNFSVSCVFLNYGQAAAANERIAASALAASLRAPFVSFDLHSGVNFGAGELLGRNAFLATAAFFLLKGQPGLYAMGLHAGTPYYDCSRAFVENISLLFSEESDGRAIFAAPFIDWTKRDVFDLFTESELPLAQTYSCEEGSKPTCGMCNSCRDRRSLGC